MKKNKNGKYFYQLIIIFIGVVVSASCTFFPMDEVEVTRAVTVEVTRVITEVVFEIVEIPVTVTPTFTPEHTSTITQTPTITPTITMTATQTKQPGIGSELNCGDSFIVMINEEPRMDKKIHGETAVGEFLLLKIEITSLLNATYDLNRNDFLIEAELNGSPIEFTPSWDATFTWVYRHYGQLLYPHDDLVPGLTAKVGIGFDVNPNAENFKLIWFPRDNMFDRRNESLCEVVIPLE